MRRRTAAYVLAALLAAAAWNAGEVAAEPVRSLTVRGTADAFAAAPSLRKFYVVREGRHAGSALEAYDARNGRFLHVVRACAHPVSLTANQRLARLYVLCTREVDDDVAASSLVTIDMRSDRTAGVVVLHDEAELHVAEADGTVVLSAGHPIVLDPRTGRVVRTLRDAGAVIEVSGLAGMVLCWDRDERLLQLVGRDGRVHGRFDPGLGRGPAGAAYAPSTHRLYVTFRNAGAVGVFDVSGALVRTLPVAVRPSLVRYDAQRDRLIVLCDSAGSTHPSLVTMRADGSERRTIVLTSTSAARNDARGRMVFDAATGRLAVAGDDALDVVDSDGPRIVATVRPPNDEQLVDVSAAAGTVAVAWFRTNTTVNAFDLRTATDTDARRPAPSPDAVVALPGGDANPPQDDAAPHFPVDPPSGVRAPRWIAFAPDGALVVASLGSGMLGTLHDGRYDERRLALRAPVAGLAIDAHGIVWLSEYARRDGSTSLARVAAGGSLREIALPRGFGGPGSTPVVDGNGDVWLYAPEKSGSVARIDAADRVHVVSLPRHRSHIVESPRRIVALGGGVAVMDDRLWTVARDGHVRQLTTLTAVMPFTNLTATADGTVSYAGAEALVDVGPDGGVVGTPLGELDLRTVETPQMRSTSTLCYPRDLARARDGTMWLTCGDTIAHVARDGTVRSFPLPDAQSAPASLVVAPDGAVWFAEPLHSRIGRLTPDGALTETII